MWIWIRHEKLRSNEKREWDHVMGLRIVIGKGESKERVRNERDQVEIGE